MFIYVAKRIFGGVGGFGGYFILKSGLRILIQGPKMPFLVPSKWIILGVLVISGVPKMAFWVPESKF